MARLNPHAIALKKIRKVELQQRLKAKKVSIEKSKKMHQVMKEARKKRVASGGLKRVTKKTVPSKKATAK